MERLKETSEKNAYQLENSYSSKKSCAYKCIPLSKKVEILKFLEAGHRQIKAAKKFKVSHTAVHRILQNKENLLRAHESLQQQQGNQDKRRLTGIEESIFEKTLFSWFIQQRDIGATVSGPMLREQALLINEKLGGPDTFKASAGWLHGFKQRHGIRSLPVPGEQFSTNHKDSEEFCKTLQSFVEVEGYSLEQIYNIDKAGLQWKALPKKTLAARNQSNAFEWKDVKDRITIMTCANVAGTHKIPLLVIGKSKEPRCFKDIKVFPVEYTNQRNACMDNVTFCHWYKNIFLPSVKERQVGNGKFLLLLDNIPALLSEEALNAIDECCTVIHLPPTVVSHIQPMEERCAEIMKRFYRKHFLRALVLHDALVGSDNVTMFLKKWNLISCFNALSRAWDDISEAALQNAWKKLLEHSKQNMMSEDIEELVCLGNQTLPEDTFSARDAREWVAIDQNDSDWPILNTDDLISSVLSNRVQEDAMSENEKDTDNSRPQSPNEESNPPTALSALAGIIQFQKWYMQQQSAKPNILLQINHMRAFAERCILNNDEK